MQYNDFIEKYDPKIFEKMSKEYDLRYKNSPKILSKTGYETTQKQDDFLQKYRTFLGLVLCAKNQKNQGNFLVKKPSDFAFEKIVKNCCKIYHEITGDYFFSSHDTYINKKNNPIRIRGKYFRK